MNIKIPYHDLDIHIDGLPDDRIRVLTGKPFETKYNVEEALLDQLEHPNNFRPLREIIRPGESIGILVPDNTREALTSRIIPFLMGYLEKYGHSPDRITIFIGKGTHRDMVPDEIEKLVGSHAGRNCTIIQPDPLRVEDYAYAGTTSRGTNASYHKQFLAMDRIILTGAINYHYFAGFGGGRKIQSICMTSWETIEANHKLSLSGPGGAFHPEVAPGILAGNPVHEDMMEIMRFRVPDFLINVILDDEGKFITCFAGHYQRAHETACAYFHKHRSVHIDRPADLVIAGCGGYPFDVNYIQAHKSLHFACRCLKPGGSIIFIAACSEGIGREHFLDWFGNRDYDSFRNALLRKYQLNGHTALATFVKTHTFNVSMYTELNEHDTRIMGIKKINDPVTVIWEHIAGLHDEGNIIVVPNGHAILPATVTGQ